MKKQKPLFVYDCDGTLQAPTAFVWGIIKKTTKKELSLLDFKAQHPGPKAMLPGMADLVRYTSTIGHNVLLSGGNPKLDGCPELLSLKNYFQDWSFEGKIVPWGNAPNNLLKSSHLVTHALLTTFLPSQVIVLGDSVDDYILAYHFANPRKTGNPIEDQEIQAAIPPVIFLRRAPSEESAPNGLPPCFSAESGAQMQHLIDKFLNITPTIKTPAPIGQIKPEHSK